MQYEHLSDFFMDLGAAPVITSVLSHCSNTKASVNEDSTHRLVTLFFAMKGGIRGAPIWDRVVVR